MDKNIYMAKNPWLAGRLPAPPKISRPIYDQVIELAENPRVLLVFGPRRAGKTTLLIELARRLIASQAAESKRVFYLDIDTMGCEDVLADPGALLKFCRIDPNSVNRQKTFILIDEIQRLHEPGLLLKALYDLNLPIRVIVTGSSAFGLRTKARQSLVGRSTSLLLWPLAPPEIPFSEDYLNWGGFPEVLLADNDAERQAYLADMWAAYVDREISGFLNIRKAGHFRSFAELLATQVGQLVNLNEFANTLLVSRDTIQRYLSFLQDCYLVRVLRPFSSNRRGELTKMPKVYFTDPGLMNLLAGNLGQIVPQAMGSVWENSVENILKKSGADLFFWRTDRGAEVDFLVKKNRDLIPIEVKTTSFSNPRITRGFRNFLKTYQPQKGFVVNASLEAEIEIEKTVLQFLPIHKLAECPDLVTN